MQLHLIRDTLTDTVTLGRLEVDGVFECYTLEDAVRDVIIRGRTAIPAGEYTVVVNFSNRFQRQMPQLLDVPGFEGIRIHSGNTDADTEGCILVGVQRNGDHLEQSRAAYNALFAKLQVAREDGDTIRISILNG